MTQFTKPTRKNDGIRVAYTNARLIDPESGLDTMGGLITRFRLAAQPPDVLVTVPAISMVAPPEPALIAFSSVFPVPLIVRLPVEPDVAAIPAENTLLVLEALTFPLVEDSEARVLDST